MIKLAVSETYPFPLGKEGATANFLTVSGNTLQIVIPDMTKEELFSLKKGKITAGFLYENGDLLWLFTFYDKKGKVFTLDSPFDVRLIPKDLLALHDITNTHQRLVIDIHVVDEKKIIRVLRAVTLPNTLTVSFLSAVQEQISCLSSGHYLSKWIALNPDDLTKLTKMVEIGK